jgi:hypothetical protein
MTFVDATAEMIKAGKKVRCLMVPFNVEPRELGQIRTIEDPRAKDLMADAERRVTALEQARGIGKTVAYAPPPQETTLLQDLIDKQHFSRGSADPPKRTDWNPKSDEFHCKVDRTKGTVEEDR